MQIELTELCQELHNWFDRERHTGSFEISDGSIAADFLQTGQYFRIVGSVFNDGIHLYPADDLQDESFDGAVWELAIPCPVIKLATEIAAWREKNEAADSANMSPFVSESFGGYSYTKSGANRSSGANSGVANWVDVFSARLNRWRKL